MKSLKSRKRQSPRRIFREVTDQVFILQTFINLLTSIFTKLMETLLIKKIWRVMLSPMECHQMDKIKIMHQDSISLIKMKYRAHQVVLS
jgi:hypothetical protein